MNTAGEFELVSPTELGAQSTFFESSSASEIIEWVFEAGGDRVLATSSFSDVVLVHLICTQFQFPKVVFIDTGFSFPETLSFIKRVQSIYKFDLDIVSANLASSDSPCGSENCCLKRKVEPLQNYLSGYEYWITGIRRHETADRSNVEIVGFDEKYQVIKVNPLANWTDEQTFNFIEENNLPIHPLVAQGYLSIGCAPTTSPVLDPSDPRSGRWPGSEKTECGLHI